MYADLGVDDVASDLADRFLVMPQDDRNAMIFLIFATLRGRLDSTRGSHCATPAGKAPPDFPLSQADRVRIFEFLPLVKEIRCRAAREAMMISNVESYSRDRRETSVFGLVMASLEDWHDA